MSDFEPFYDVSRSYEDNYEQGPFGAFAEALKDGLEKLVATGLATIARV